MNMAIPDYANSSVLDQSKKDFFLFNSSSGLVRGDGISERISTPILSPTFNIEVQELFERESKKGVKNPILVGAIPFDMTQPTQLFSPEFFQRTKPLKKQLAELTDNSFSHNVINYSFTPDNKQFLAMIEQAISLFKTSDLKKVVLSKILELKLDKPVNISRLLTNIILQNPNAYHFNVPLENSTLVGASPELLLKKQGNHIYSNPLAGSAKRLPNKAADQQASEELLISLKDQYEHRIVVDAIRASLTPLVKELNIPSQPSLISTPTMWHLSTKIEAILSSSNPTSVFDIIKKMHPTPAMCGTPTLLAHQQIDKLEPHHRHFFSGLVGWCDSLGNSEWAIAIRCAEVSGNDVKLFAGAGVVPDSIPDIEWSETCSKMRTMMNAFGIKEGLL